MKAIDFRLPLAYTFEIVAARNFEMFCQST